MFNLAASGVQPGDRDPNELLSGNAGLLINLLQAVAEWPGARFVHAGSCYEYGRCKRGVRLRESAPLEPTSVYGAAKVAAWHCGRALARQLRIPLVTLRLFGCFGFGEAPQRLVPYVIRKLLAAEPIDLTAGTQARDFLHIEDVTSALVATARCGPFPADVFNVCSGKATSVRSSWGS